MERLKDYCNQRKHGKQMSLRERKVLWKRVQSFDEWKVSYHTYDRLEQKRIRATYEDLVSTIWNASIIEYRIEQLPDGSYDERVILRSNTIVNHSYNLNVVYSIKDGVIVTAWINHIDDKHKTLDWSIYNEKMKVFGEEILEKVG